MLLNNLLLEREDKKIYREGNLLVKIFDEKYAKSDVLNEALNNARVEEGTDLLVPTLESVELINGNWAILQTYVEGTTMEEMMDNDPENVDKYLEKFVELQISVLSHKVPMLNNLTDKMQARISMANLDATTRYELHTRLDSMRRHKNLCHGDFNPSNIIVDNEGAYHIIDWSHATQGNASADVARTYLLFYLQGKENIAEKYLNLYCKKSDTAKQYVQKWIPIVAASRLTKSKSEEKEFLMHWIDVVEYE